jgi:hypothetical protein
MDSTNQRRVVGLAVILGAALVTLFVIGTLMASCQASPGPSAQPTASGAPSPGEPVPNGSTSSLAPSSSPAGSAEGSPVPRGSFPAPSTPLAGATSALPTLPPEPGEPGSTIEIPPPIR